MSYDPKAIANEFLEIAKAAGEELTAMKLQKLVYFAHGWHLALTDRPLINETVEAWKWGPVVPSLYREFKRFGEQPIKALATDLRRTSRGFSRISPRVPQNDRAGVYANALVEKTWNLYGRHSAAQLSRMTHEPGTPWYEIWTPMKDDPILGTDIPNGLITTHFKDRLRK